LSGRAYAAGRAALRTFQTFQTFQTYLIASACGKRLRSWFRCSIVSPLLSRKRLRQALAGEATKTWEEVT